jgi:aspartyl-tRNA synthetase
MHAYRTQPAPRSTRTPSAPPSACPAGFTASATSGVLFIDLRDHYGITQIVADSDSPALPHSSRSAPNRSSPSTGTVKRRSEATVNGNLATGEIEVFATAVTVQSPAQELPLPPCSVRQSIRRTSPSATAP